MKNELIVQKYGGATLADPEKIKQVARRIFNLHQSGSKVVVIVSAMGETTNQLLKLAQQVSNRPPLRELDMLLTTGERVSMALLSMALNDLGCPAISFTGSQAGIITDDLHVNANIIDVKAFRVEEALKADKVVILAGFQGVSQNTKEITTLGRGGSDITAVAIAGYLKADRCEILKDVDSVFTADPKLVKNAKRLRYLSFQHLLEMTSWGAKVLHHRSVKLAAEKNVQLYIGAATDNNNTGTTVSNSYDHGAQSILAINSYSQVFQMTFFENDQKQFHSFLQQNQIGELQLLHSVQKEFYYTAPSETLASLVAFEKKQSFFKILNGNLASVSVTFSSAVADTELNALKGLLEKNNIKLLEYFHARKSLHFFVEHRQRNEAIQYLHDSITSA